MVALEIGVSVICPAIGEFIDILSGILYGTVVSLNAMDQGMETSKATSKESCIEILEEIKQQLLDGTFKIN